MTPFQYWKKMYLLFGDNFNQNIWADKTSDEEWENLIYDNKDNVGWYEINRKSYNVNRNDVYVVSAWDGIMRFTSKFYKELENEI